MDGLPAEGFIKPQQLLNVVKLSKSTLLRMVAAGRFPPPIKLGARMNRWNVDHVRDWMKSPETYRATQE